MVAEVALIQGALRRVDFSACADYDYVVSTRTLRFVSVVSILLICFGLAWAIYSWLSLVSTDGFNAAIQGRDFSHARKIWKRGLVRETADPFPQFMGILDDLEKRKTVRVTDYRISRSVASNEYSAVMHIQTVDGQGGVVLRWENGGWRLFSNQEFVPTELRQILAERKTPTR
jgi:hypothetical protein